MLTATNSPALYLDYGADAQVCAHGDLDISERGMRFNSRWQFSIGTQISVALVQMDPQRGLCRMAVDGLVVFCEPKGDKGYENTLLFLELPDELKPSLREFSLQLATVAES